MLSLILHEIRSRRMAIIGWGIGLTLFGVMYTTIFPQFQELLGSFAEIGELGIYQAMGVEMATFEGYLASTVLGFIPILLGVYAVMTSTAALAGEEDAGTLELLLSTRLTRWQIVTAKAIGILVALAIIILIAGLGNALGFGLVQNLIETDVVPTDVFVVVLAALPLVGLIAMIGLFLGTVMPNRRLAMTIGLLIVIASYFGENMGGLIEQLNFIQPFSIFSYFNSTASVFTDGIALSDIVLLEVLALIFFGLALVFFQRRDVTVGNWPWQRVRITG